MSINVVDFQPIRGTVSSGSTITLSYSIEGFTGTLNMRYTGEGVTLDGAESQVRTHTVTSSTQVFSDSFKVVGTDGTHAIVMKSEEGGNSFKDEFYMA